MKWLSYILCLITFQTFGQGGVGYIIDEEPLDSTIQPSLKLHSEFKPAIRLAIKNALKLEALSEANYIMREQSYLKVGAGFNFEGQLKDKWYFRIASLNGIANLDSIYYPKSYLIFGEDTSYYGYADIHSRVSFTPNHIFNFQAGIDNNFIGEGSRSLLLSDYGATYPFAQIRARFWRLEYSVLYQFMRERNAQNWQGKFAASHHISFNAAKWLNLGIFESVIFQPRDTALNRGFDVEYLNPVIFYRPQEYSLGSSDNVLLGVSATGKYKTHTIYSQFILDEFYLSEIRARSGWWANKFGVQFGVKGRVKNNWFYRIEYNAVRPYTYSHLSEELNYGNQGSSLAHPYGSNFMEILGEVKYQKEKMLASVFYNYYLTGTNQNGYNYGNNIYDPYINRPYEYGHFIGQGQQLNVSKLMFRFQYKLTDYGKLNAFIEDHIYYHAQPNLWRNMLVVGVRSNLWNDRRNY